MYDPQTMSPGSIMPPYPWLITDDLNTKYTAAKIDAMRTLGVPYPEEWDEAAILGQMNTQAQEITQRLKDSDVQCAPEKEIIALIAYLQRLGTDIQATPTASVN